MDVLDALADAKRYRDELLTLERQAGEFARLLEPARAMVAAIPDEASRQRSLESVEAREAEYAAMLDRQTELRGLLDALAAPAVVLPEPDPEPVALDTTPPDTLPTEDTEAAAPDAPKSPDVVAPDPVVDPAAPVADATA